MKTILALLFVAIGANGALIYDPTVTGPTPEPCEAKLDANACAGRDDGNYEFVDKSTGKPVLKFFTQCSNGNAYCQPCWPEYLEFSPRCNQCLYSKHDDCYTTESWEPHSTFECPDLCQRGGKAQSGNLADPKNGKHYVGCWEGVLVGCVVCPADLLFNEEYNACLYDGKHITQPQK